MLESQLIKKCFFRPCIIPFQHMTQIAPLCNMFKLLPFIDLANWNLLAVKTICVCVHKVRKVKIRFCACLTIIFDTSIYLVTHARTIKQKTRERARERNKIMLACKIWRMKNCIICLMESFSPSLLLKRDKHYSNPIPMLL